MRVEKIEKACGKTMPKIFILNESGNARCFEIASDTVYIGRSVEKDIQLRDRFISRRHLKINRSEDRFFIKELNSTNGTFINGKQIISGLGCEVDEGEPIVVGMSVVCIGKGVKDDLQSILNSMDPCKELIANVYDLEKDRPLTFRKNVELINKVSNLLLKSMDIDSVLGEALEYILAHFKRVDKGAIILIDEETTEISSVITRCKEDLEDVDTWYSQDVVDMVIHNGKPIIISDTDDMDDMDDYNLSDTLKVLKIGSVLCVPLINDNRMRGVIYIDSVHRPYGFRKEDLSVFMSLSTPIAMNIDNRSIH